MGPRFRGDDDPLWRLLHNAARLTKGFMLVPVSRHVPRQQESLLGDP